VVVSELVVAGSPGLVRPGEKAFIEAGREVVDLSYGTVLNAEDCAAIDDEAYRVARTWYSAGDGRDLSLAEGVSLGLALEHPVVLRVVAHLRARLALERLRPVTSVTLRSSSPGWDTAAAALGLPVRREGKEVRRAPQFNSPGVTDRVMHRLLSSRRGPATQVLIHPTRWAFEDYLALAHERPSVIFNPGRRFPLALALRGQRAILRRLSINASPDPAILHELATRHELGAVIEPVVAEFGGLVPQAVAIASTMARQARVAITTEDASPPLRAAVLALRAAGVRTISLEHGISGSYRHQVQSVARLLALWGEPQAEYHRHRQQLAAPVVIGATRMERLWARGPDAAPRYDAVFFAQPAPALSAGSWPEDQVRAWKLVGEVASLRPSWRVVVKAHPASLAYDWTGSDAPSLPHVYGSSEALIRQARVVIVAGSTAGAEAMAVGVPVVQIVARGPMAEASLLAGGSRPVTNATELAAALEAMLTVRAEQALAVEAGREHARRLVEGIDERGHAARCLRQIADGAA
jgi:hypothetical protein